MVKWLNGLERYLLPVMRGYAGIDGTQEMQNSKCRVQIDLCRYPPPGGRKTGNAGLRAILKALQREKWEKRDGPMLAAKCRVQNSNQICKCGEKIFSAIFAIAGVFERESASEAKSCRFVADCESVLQKFFEGVH